MELPEPLPAGLATLMGTTVRAPGGARPGLRCVLDQHRGKPEARGGGNPLIF